MNFAPRWHTGQMLSRHTSQCDIRSYGYHRTWKGFGLERLTSLSCSPPFHAVFGNDDATPWLQYVAAVRASAATTIYQHDPPSHLMDLAASIAEVPRKLSFVMSDEISKGFNTPRFSET